MKNETYTITIRDYRTGRTLRSRGGLDSAYNAGLAATHHSAALLAAGHAHLSVEFHVVEAGSIRPITQAEEAAMVSARDQSIAQLTEEAS